MNDLDLDNRYFKIIKLLKQNYFATMDLIAQKLNVSTKTIRNDIKYLNNMFNNSAIIELKQGTYHLYVIDKLNFDKMCTHLFKKHYIFESSKGRVGYIFKRLLESEKPLLIDDLSDDMSIARTTFITDLKKLRKELEEYKIQILGKTNNGLILEGNEIDIRIFILENLYENIYQNSSVSPKIEEIIDKISKNNEMEIFTINKMKKSFNIMLNRMKIGKTINSVENKYISIKNTKAFSFICSICCELEKVADLNISENERIFLTLPIISMRIPMNISSIKNIEMEEEIANLAQKIILSIKTELNIVINGGEIFDEFLWHLYFMINRLKFGIKIKNPILDEIKNKHIIEYKMAELTKSIIEAEYKANLSDDEVGFLALYFSIFISENIKSTNSICKIAVICGTGRVTARLILTQLRRILPPETQIDLFSENEINKNLLEEYDLVCSTVRLNIETETPVIYLNEIFDENEFSKKLKKMRLETGLYKNSLEGIDSILIRLLEEDRFFILDNNLSYEENIAIMIDSLYQNGYVDETFKKRIQEREEKSSMIFDKYIAMPHIINYKTGKIVLSLGIFKEEFIKNNKPLKLVFLIGVPEKITEDEFILIQLYNEIISIANNKNIIENIVNLRNYKELLLYFIKDELFLN